VNSCSLNARPQTVKNKSTKRSHLVRVTRTSTRPSLHKREGDLFDQDARFDVGREPGLDESSQPSSIDWRQVGEEAEDDGGRRV
jgi:hypothetical protein